MKIKILCSFLVIFLGMTEARATFEGAWEKEQESPLRSWLKPAPFPDLIDMMSSTTFPVFQKELDVLREPVERHKTKLKSVLYERLKRPYFVIECDEGFDLVLFKQNSYSVAASILKHSRDNNVLKQGFDVFHLGDETHFTMTLAALPVESQNVSILSSFMTSEEKSSDLVLTGLFPGNPELKLQLKKEGAMIPEEVLASFKTGLPPSLFLAEVEKVEEQEPRNHLKLGISVLLPNGEDEDDIIFKDMKLIVEMLY